MIPPQLSARWMKTYRERVAPQVDGPFTPNGGQELMLFEDDRPFYDFTGGSGTLPLGHGNMLVRDAMVELTKFFWSGGIWGESYNGFQMEFIELLAQYFPKGHRVTLFASENEALYAAACPAQGKSTVWLNRAYPPMTNFPAEFDPASWRASVEDVPLSMYVDRVIVSSVNPETHAPIDGVYLNQIVEWCEDHDIQLVWDDTVACMGWTGAVTTCPAHIDICVLGGALGGGLPLGAIVAWPEAYQPPTDTLPVSTRFAGSPLAVTAGLHTLRQLIPILEGRNLDLNELIEHLADDWAQLPLNDLVTGVNLTGLLASIEFTHRDVAEQVIAFARAAGVLLSGDGNVVRVAVPLVATPDDDLQELIQVLSGAIDKATKDSG